MERWLMVGSEGYRVEGMLVHNDGFVGSNVQEHEKDYAYLKAAASGSSIDMIFLDIISSHGVSMLFAPFPHPAVSMKHSG